MNNVAAAFLVAFFAARVSGGSLSRVLKIEKFVCALRPQNEGT